MHAARRGEGDCTHPSPLPRSKLLQHATSAGGKTDEPLYPFRTQLGQTPPMTPEGGEEAALPHCDEIHQSYGDSLASFSVVTVPSTSEDSAAPCDYRLTAVASE